MEDRLERNKRAVTAFYDLMFNRCRPREAVEKYVGAEYIQHNPGVVSGKQGFIVYFEEAAREYPGKRVDPRPQAERPLLRSKRSLTLLGMTGLVNAQ